MNKSLLLFLFILHFDLAFCQLVKTEPKSTLQYIISEQPNAKNLVILIHGYGSNERDLRSLSPIFSTANVVSVRGPIPITSDGFCWYNISFQNDGNHQRNLMQAYESEAKLLEFISSMEALYPHTNIIIGGFSQGSIMSSHIALTNPQAIDGIICLSGILLEPIENIAKATPKSYTQLKAFLAHGTTDPLLSIAKGRICSTALTEVGINVTHKEYPIKHQISQQEVQDLELWYHQNFIDN